METRKDYYKVLGVSRGADDEEIRRAYRKMSFQCHPDFFLDDSEKAARFREITEAYEILLDSEKRRRYDQADGVTVSAGANAARDDFFARLWRVTDNDKEGENEAS